MTEIGTVAFGLYRSSRVLKRRLVSCFLIFAAGGCSTTGVEVSDAQTHEFVIGQSTLSEVEAKLGPPTGSATGSSGTQTITYERKKNKSDPLAFVPIAGMFSYGSKSDVRDVVFVFNNLGILLSYHADNRTS